MDETEIKSLIDQLKAGGLDDEKIMDVFYQAFEKGKMGREDLETLANAMGYELTDDFKSDEHPDPIESPEGADGAEGVSGLSEEQLEDARSIDEGETAGEFEDKIEDLKGEAGEPNPGEPEDEPEEPEGDKPEDEPEDKPEDDGDDWEKAQKLFKI